MNNFTLTNDNAPAFAKPDKLAFQPPSNAQNIRQQIYKILATRPDDSIELTTLIQATAKPYRTVYNAAKTLVMKGFATRVNKKVQYNIKETDPTKFKHKWIICLKYVHPWEAKGKKKW